MTRSGQHSSHLWLPGAARSTSNLSAWKCALKWPWRTAVTAGPHQWKSHSWIRHTDGRRCCVGDGDGDGDSSCCCPWIAVSVSVSVVVEVVVVVVGVIAGALCVRASVAVSVVVVVVVVMGATAGVVCVRVCRYVSVYAGEGSVAAVVTVANESRAEVEKSGDRAAAEVAEGRAAVSPVTSAGAKRRGARSLPSMGLQCRQQQRRQGAQCKNK